MNTRSVFAKLMLKKILSSWVLVVIRDRSWGMNHIYESPHKDKGIRMCVNVNLQTWWGIPISVLQETAERLFSV